MLIVLADMTDPVAVLEARSLADAATARAWRSRLVVLDHDPAAVSAVDGFGLLMPLTAEMVDEDPIARWLAQAGHRRLASRVKSVRWRWLLARAAHGRAVLVGPATSSIDDWLWPGVRVGRLPVPQQPQTAAADRHPALDRPAILRADGATPLVVVGVGSPDWQDGFDLFVELVHHVVTADPAGLVRFRWVATEPAMAPAIEHDIAHLGVADHLEIVESRGDPRADLSGAHVLLRLSRRPTSPRLVLEAAAAGCIPLGFASAAGHEADFHPAARAVIPFGDLATVAALVHRLVEPDGPWAEQSMQLRSTHGRTAIERLLDSIGTPDLLRRRRRR